MPTVHLDGDFMALSLAIFSSLIDYRQRERV